MAISFKVELDDEMARVRLRALLERIENRQPFLNRLGQKLADSTRGRFLTESQPDGSHWQSLSPATILARQRRRRSAERILSESGNLAGSIHHEATSAEVRIGATPEYAAIHQLGGTIDMPARRRKLRFRAATKTEGAGRRFAKKTRKRGVTEQDVDVPAYQINIPARPFLGIDTYDLDDIHEEAHRWLSGERDDRYQGIVSSFSSLGGKLSRF